LFVGGSGTLSPADDREPFAAAVLEFDPATVAASGSVGQIEAFGDHPFETHRERHAGEILVLAKVRGTRARSDGSSSTRGRSAPVVGSGGPESFSASRGCEPGGVVMVFVVANQKGGVGKTTTAANVAVLLARRERVLVIDSDPQFALTRQFGVEVRALGVNLVDVLAGRADAPEAIVSDVFGVYVIPEARELAGIEMSLVGELARERFLRDALDSVVGDYEHFPLPRAFLPCLTSGGA
jgi:Mrp family chromosome partitioning ATPase